MLEENFSYKKNFDFKILHIAKEKVILYNC